MSAKVEEPPAPVPGALAVLPKTAAKQPEMPAVRPASQLEDPAHEGSEVPIVLHVATMSKYEKDKVKRIVTPKATTGNLAVPRDIYEMWQTEKGKENLLNMWCKSGGVKARSTGDPPKKEPSCSQIIAS